MLNVYIKPLGDLQHLNELDRLGTYTMPGLSSCKKLAILQSRLEFMLEHHLIQ